MVNVSIIVTCGEQQQELRALLPLLLSQEYDEEYEVIVVDKLHDKDMEEWLEEKEALCPHLNHTFCPASSRGIDVHRLALTLGAKSANYPWLVILPVDTVLIDSKWLSGLAGRVNDQVDIVIFKEKNRSRWSWLRNIFHRPTSIFHFPSSVLICRRSILLQGQNAKLSDWKVVKS